MKKIGFIGMGNMGYAIMSGLLKTMKPEEMIFSNLHREKGERISRETGVPCVENNGACAAEAEYLVLAVKPQYYPVVLKEISGAVREGQPVISLAPGITSEQLCRDLGGKVRVVRAMPNTPALLGEGMTGVSYDRTQFSEEEQEMIASVFTAFGKMELVEERLMDAVVCVSGSSPAFVYLFIEALADSGVKYGLPRDTAYRMAAQAVAGSAKMVLETGEHPGRLKDQVCSPGGTTIAGVAALEEYGFRNAVLKAGDACYEKCTKIR